MFLFVRKENEGSGPVRYADLYKREKARIEMAYMSKKKNSYLIAPDSNLSKDYFLVFIIIVSLPKITLSYQYSLSSA